MLNPPLRRWLAISCLAFIVTACGGGGGGSGGSNSGSSSGAPNSNPARSPSSSPSTSPSTPASAPKNINLSWTIPAAREDGSPLAASAITAYRLFYTRDGSAASEDTVVVIGSGNTTRTSLSLALAGTYTFAITAIDLNGIESSLSAPVSITVN